MFKRKQRVGQCLVQEDARLLAGFIQAVHSGNDLESAIHTCLSIPEVNV